MCVPNWGSQTTIILGKISLSNEVKKINKKDEKKCILQLYAAYRNCEAHFCKIGFLKPQRANSGNFKLFYAIVPLFYIKGY